MRTAGRIIIAVTLLLAPLFASGQMLIRWPAGSVLSAPQLAFFGGADNFFGIEKIDDDTFARIDGISFGRGCTTPRKDLRLLHILHRNFAGQTQVGEMIHVWRGYEAIDEKLRSLGARVELIPEETK